MRHSMEGSFGGVGMQGGRTRIASGKWAGLNVVVEVSLIEAVS